MLLVHVLVKYEVFFFYFKCHGFNPITIPTCDRPGNLLGSPCVALIFAFDKLKTLKNL